ncbi:MAG: hypothetical protein LBP36_03170 [Oscillospiraceae bacterium]|jgi:hypothetical protein|nr:hypothetical protein [Oscillospiraceae bacterium]
MKPITVPSVIKVQSQIKKEFESNREALSDFISTSTIKAMSDFIGCRIAGPGGLYLCSPSGNLNRKSFVLRVLNEILIGRRSGYSEVINFVIKIRNKVRCIVKIDIQGLREAYKYIERNVHDVSKISTNIVESTIIDLMIYLHDLLYLEYNYLRTTIVSDDEISVPDGTSYIEVDEFGELFPNNGNPQFYEVVQGKGGDCYLLSALSSLAINSPESIKECFLNKESFKEDKDVRFRFYRVMLGQSDTDDEGVVKMTVTPVSPVIINVPKTSLRYSYNGKDVYAQGEALWVKFIEKAFAIYKSIHGSVIVQPPSNKFSNDILSKWRRPTADKFRSDNIGGGFSSIVISAITKKRTTLRFKPRIPRDKNDKSVKKFSGAYSPSAKATYDYIVRKLEKNLAVTAMTGVMSEVRRKKYAARGRFSPHVYAVLAAGEKDYDGKCYKTITLRNPHATVSTDYLRGANGKFKVNVLDATGGMIVLELNDFMKHFTMIESEKMK